MPTKEKFLKVHKNLQESYSSAKVEKINTKENPSQDQLDSEDSRITKK
jgi:hypothetical protein